MLKFCKCTKYGGGGMKFCKYRGGDVTKFCKYGGGGDVAKLCKYRGMSQNFVNMGGGWHMYNFFQHQQYISSNKWYPSLEKNSS